MHIKHHISLIVGSALMGAAVVLWAMPTEKSLSHHISQYPRVLLDFVQAEQTKRSVCFAGVTQAKNRTVLSFAVPARIVSRMIESGSIVQQGQILARLDDREFRNAVALARAAVTEMNTQLGQARRDRIRMEQLSASKVAPAVELEKVTTRQAALESSLQAAETRLKETRRLLNETVLMAPFSGTVTNVLIQPGEWVVPGQPAIELTGNGKIELMVHVPETMLNRISAGQKVRVRLPFTDNRIISGRVSSVAKAALAAGRLFPLKVDIKSEPGVVAGLTAELIVDLSAQKVLTVPLSAVVNPGVSQPYLFIYTDGIALKRPVSLGGIIDDRIIVSGDMVAGDRVVISGQSQLTDGDRVEAEL